jgi:signal transduction histidine kinase
VELTSVHDPVGRLVGFAQVVRNLTFGRQAEQGRLRLAQEQEANRVKDELPATTAHELRAPLTAILGWCILLITRFTAPAGNKALNTIRRNAQAQAGAQHQRAARRLACHQWQAAARGPPHGMRQGRCRSDLCDARGHRIKIERLSIG